MIASQVGFFFLFFFYVQGILEATEFMLSSNIKPKRSFYISFGHDEEVRLASGLEVKS